MFLEALVQNGERLKAIRSALSLLHSADMFPVLFEIGAKRCVLNRRKEYTTEENAARIAWREGYDSALEDLFHFFERHVPGEQIKKPKPDFGALDDLLKRQEITQEEYDELSTIEPE